MATCKQRRAWLADAEEKLHSLRAGGAVVMVQHGEKRVQYSEAKLGELVRYVALLQDQVDACDGASTTNRRRIIGFIPG